MSHRTNGSGWALGAALLSSACAEESLQQRIECARESGSFASETVASDFALGYAITNSDGLPATGVDAIVIPTPRPAEIETDARWHLSTVDVLLVRPATPFTGDLADDGSDYAMTVEVWEGDDPSDDQARHWSIPATVPPDTLQWTPHETEVEFNTGVPQKCGAAGDCPQKDDRCVSAGNGQSYCRHGGKAEIAWWSFDLLPLLKAEDLKASHYTVGIRWQQAGRPMVAGSQYDKSCDLNWNISKTDNGEEVAVNIGDRARKAGRKNPACNWPMLRLSGRTITMAVVCK